MAWVCIEDQGQPVCIDRLGDTVVIHSALHTNCACLLFTVAELFQKHLFGRLVKCDESV